MANKDHWDILKQGVEVWNNWRAQHPGIDPDLEEVNLNQVDYTGADFSHVNFRKAQIDHTTLCDTNLQGADLRQAEISFTNL